MYYEGQPSGDLYLVKKAVQLQFADHNYIKYYAFEWRLKGRIINVWPATLFQD